MYLQIISRWFTFQDNSFLSGDALRILLTLDVDDFEICNPLGTFCTKQALCDVLTLSNLPRDSHSSLSSIYLAVLCKTNDVNKYNHGSFFFLFQCFADVRKARFRLLWQVIWELTVLLVLMRALLQGISVDFAQELEQTSKQKSQVHLLPGQKNFMTLM